MCEAVQNQVVSKWDQEMANGTPHFEHIPLKSKFPQVLSGGRWDGKPDCSFPGARNETWAQPLCTCIKCAEPSPGRPESFYVWLENRFEAATKTPEHKRLRLWDCVSFVLGMWR